MSTEKMSTEKKAFLLMGLALGLLIYGIIAKIYDTPNTNMIEPNIVEPNLPEEIRNYISVIKLPPLKTNEPNELIEPNEPALTGLDLEYFLQAQKVQLLTSRRINPEEVINSNELLILWNQENEKLQKIGREIIINTLFENKLAPIRVEEDGKEYIECSFFNEFHARFLAEHGNPEYGSPLFLWAGQYELYNGKIKTNWSIFKIFYNSSLETSVKEALDFLKTYQEE